MAVQIDHGSLMDRVYRRQRHVYDATRRYYLLGRDPMIAGLKPPVDGSVLEIGCGTGRNLVKAAKLYPQAKFHGIDISQEMLATAQKSVASAQPGGRISLACADASSFDPVKLFGQEKFDRIFISYAVSMIPDWQAVLRDAVAYLAPGGELHIVDFGDQCDLPDWFRKALYTWLGWYHVTPRNDLFDVSASIAASFGATTQEKHLYRGFAWISIIRRLQS